MKSTASRRLSFIFLCLVPLVSVIVAFAIGRSPREIYIPIWLINVAAMLCASWVLGARNIRSLDLRKKRIAVIGLLFISPWMLASIFAGMGPPPFTMHEWAELASEQQVRFNILIVCAILLTFGFSLLYDHLKSLDEQFYSRFGFTAIIIAIPLMIIGMILWGNMITEAFVTIDAIVPRVTPDWLKPMRSTVDAVVVVWVALIYVACIFFSLSLRATKLLKSRVYTIASLAALILSLLPSTSPEPLATMNYVVGIPAVTFVIPYLMGANLLRWSSEGEG